MSLFTHTETIFRGSSGSTATIGLSSCALGPLPIDCDRFISGGWWEPGPVVVASSVRASSPSRSNRYCRDLRTFLCFGIRPTLIAVPSEHDLRRSRTHNHIPHVDRSSHREYLWQ